MSDSFDVIMSAVGASETVPAVGGMVWVPGGTFVMGSDRHYPEEAPAHPVTVGGFWIDSGPVTNAEFARFVRKTGHVTTAETAPDPADYPGARPDLLVPFSAVFIAPRRRVSLADPGNWWTPVTGADWRHPQGPGSSVRGKPDHPVVHVAWADAAAYASWAGKQIPAEAEWELAARGGLDGAEFAWGDELTPGGQWMANTWQGEFPGRHRPGRLPGHLTGRRLPRQRLRPVRHDRQRLGMDRGLVPRSRGPGARLLHAAAGPRPGGQHRPERSGAHPAQGHEGRLAPVRAELLPPLPARRPDAAARRHLNQPPGLPLHHPARVNAPH